MLFVCKCECITKERAESIQSVQDTTFVIVGAVLVGVSVVFMVFLAVRHEYVVENWSCVGSGSRLEEWYEKAAVLFLHFWIWPLAATGAGIALLVLGTKDNSGYFGGCCKGYDACDP